MLSYDDVKNPDILEKIKQEDFSAYKDAYVKIICSNKQNPVAFDALLEKLYKVAPADITVLEADLNSQIKENLEAEEVDQKNDTPTILNKYIDGLTLPVDNAEMKKFMQEIYVEAVSQEHVQ
jgi:hypothetical protein